MYQRDAIHNGQSGKFSSLKYLRKPQRITNQIESNTMNNVLRRNTDLNKSNVLMDRALDSLAGKPHLEVSEDDLSKDLSERLNFDEGGDPLDVGSASTGNEPSLSMNEYFPIAETSQSPAVEEEKEEEECISPLRRLPKLDTENDDDDDEPEDRYLHSRRLSSIFKPPSILLTRSKSLPTSPFEKKPDPERPLLFKRSKSVHFAQSERFEVKYFREDESPLFLRNESGEYGTKSGKLRKSRRHRRREAQEDTDRLEMGSGPRNLELINGNLTLRGQTPTSLKLDVFGMMSNHFKNFNNNNGGYHFHSPFKLNQSDSNFNLRAPFKPNFGFKLDSFGDSETELPLRNHGKIGDGKKNWKTGEYDKFRTLIYYYYFMLFDVIVRFEWVFYMVKNNTDYVRHPLVSLALATMEIIRRFNWVILRVENEHVANVHLFKVTDDNWQLPFPVTEEGGEIAREDEYSVAAENMDNIALLTAMRSNPESETLPQPRAHSVSRAERRASVFEIIPWAHATDFQRPLEAPIEESAAASDSETDSESLV